MTIVKWNRWWRPNWAHVITFTDTGFGLTHPPRCGLTYTCPVHRGLKGSFASTAKRGMWVSR